MTTSTMMTTELTAADRCDQCGAQALVVALFNRRTRELYFCGHDFTLHEAKIMEQGGKVTIDNRQQLVAAETSKPKPRPAHSANHPAGSRL